ncbi:MAG: hypothetical protein QOH42_2055 [Blastocatellia bacterium]|jgi:hypothetical protein|nr:hypothetical protein [Blastocatellia bacterium]
MRTLRKLGPAIALAMVLATHAFAAPCAPPEPGQTSTPPCEMQSTLGDIDIAIQKSSVPGYGGTPVANETSLTRIAADLLLEFLPLF